MDKAFLECLSEIFAEPGKSTRKLKVQLGFRLCKKLGLNGSRGDIKIVACTIGVGRAFAKRIVLCSVNGQEEDLFVKPTSSRSFLNSEWHPRFDEFAFRPEHARSVPGY